MRNTLRILVVVVILLLMTACTEHGGETHISSTLPSSTSSVPTSTVSVPKPTESIPTDPCSKGHSFPNNANVCSVCGADYFSVALNFKLNETKDGYIVSGVGVCDRTEIFVPATYNGLPVTEIGESAFNAIYDSVCSQIAKVYLPDSIEKIDESAFLSCESLKEIQLPENLVYIGPSAFQFCESLTEMAIPSNVTYLGGYAFAECFLLQKVLLQDGILEIGENTFEYCSSLKSIYIPKAIKDIPSMFAMGCESLENVEFGGEITSIGKAAFVECKSLKTIDLGSKLEKMGPLAFFRCSALTEITLPDTVKRIDESAFKQCTSLRKIRIPNGLEVLGNEIVTGCEQLEFNIYQGMQYLGDEKNPYLILVGRSDASQKHLIVHEDTRFIPDNKTFFGSDIQSIYIGKSVECIYGLSEEDYRSGVPFSNMDALEKIEVSPENKTYHASGNCLIETAAKSLVQGCKNSVIPDDGSVEIIYGFSFQYQDGLVSLVIPNSVKTIGIHAFRGCANLKWLVIGTGVKDIDNEILWEVSNVTVYYMGTAEDWEKIQIVGINVSAGWFGSNGYLKKAPRYYYSETAPTDSGNYWHYVDGIPTPWESVE